MTADHFEATFVLGIDRAEIWDRLTENPRDAPDGPEQLWLPGFDGSATVTERDDQVRLRATKDDEPCAGTDIVVTLTDEGTGTRVTVVQSGFGDWMAPLYDVMAVGWRHIVADLETYLATGVHGRRHFRPWGDLGADVEAIAGGLRIGDVRRGSLGDDLGLREGDLLLVLAGAPLSSHDDLVTVLRVLGPSPGAVDAELVRHGELVTTTAVQA